ncbi:uncharacterized protein L199_001296 [Kwoniella botswanensis]|uniref:uncharacterized protein n=1 Tax=Kwoniella botswanensis TaxID=1268659 RepID=UPI00315CBC78
MSDNPTLIPPEDYFGYSDHPHPLSDYQDTNQPLRYSASSSEVNDTLINPTSVSSSSGIYDPTATSYQPDDFLPPWSKYDHANMGNVFIGGPDEIKSSSSRRMYRLSPGSETTRGLSGGRFSGGPDSFAFGADKPGLKERNRLSAQRYRDRKVQAVNDSKELNFQLMEENRQLRLDLDSMTSKMNSLLDQMLIQTTEINTLKARLSRHENVSTTEAPWLPEQRFAVPGM